MSWPLTTPGALPQAGLVLLAAAGALTVASGLPAFVALLLVSALGALFGVLSGALEPALLGALPGRLVGLLEHDLLQAVPLFVLVGAMLHRLPLAALLYRCAARLAGRGPLAPRAGALALAALLAPMNGSVGASAALLSRLVLPRLRAAGAAPADAVALTSAASTLGVLVPPSLVLLLLGDAMMRAHTEALNSSGRSAQIVNTQDLLMGALLPAALGLLAFVVAAGWPARRAAPPVQAEPAPTPREWLAAGCTLAALLALLGGVAVGRFLAVEAAATGALLMFVGGVLSGHLRGARLRELLHDTLVTSGALLALFIAATSFTLLLRGFGTDRWVEALFARAAPGAAGALGIGLGTMLVCGLVLDAFELVFVVVPLLMPPVLVRVEDAAWVGVLALLVLQASFLAPPMGYAVTMVGSRSPDPLRVRALCKALLPYLLAQGLVIGAVLAWPRLVHPGAATVQAPTAPALNDDEVMKLMRDGGGRTSP
jgi:tripartite ATP-independent transporter DctM subunit